MIVLLGGTSEGRELFRRLQDRAFPCLMSVASNYGKKLLQALPQTSASQVRVGKLPARDMEKMLQEFRAELLVDATHPFAVEVSRNAMQAAWKVGVPYLRLEREKEEVPDHPLIFQLSELNELSGVVQDEEVIFSTLGSNHLEQLVSLLQNKNCRLICRVLPQSEMLRKGEDLGLNASQLVALPGPFSRALNRELFRHFNASWMVTKESGSSGGQQDKIKAALDLGIKVALWLRPKLDYPQVCHSVEEVLKHMQNYNKI